MSNEPNKPIPAQELSEEELGGIVGGAGVNWSLNSIGGGKDSSAPSGSYMAYLFDTSTIGGLTASVDSCTTVGNSGVAQFASSSSAF